MHSSQIINILRSNKSYLAERFGITHLSLFGSFATHTNHENSDIDLLFENNKDLGMTLGRLNNLERYIQELLNFKKIELVNKKNIHPIVFDNAKKSLIEIF
jgi:predicted nucleotidyltransferase